MMLGERSWPGGARRKRPRSSVLRRALLGVALAVVAASMCARIASAQTGNPADSAADGDRKAAEAPAKPAVHLRSWELPPVTLSVTAEGAPALHEEELIGTNAQPRWTAARRFGETRIYVVPEGQFEFEYWLIPKLRRNGEETEIESRYEAEIGLPARFQLDLYLVTHQVGNQGPLQLDESKFEVRWAFAKWGRLWGNPAVYLEWAALSNAPDHVEGKLLLGDQIRPRLHWGANLVFEHEMGGEQANAYEVTGGLSYTIKDEKFSVGAETKVAFEDVESDRGNFSKEYLVGPSIQVRPLPQAHFNLSALTGLGDESPRAKFFLIIGWEF